MLSHFFNDFFSDTESVSYDLEVKIYNQLYFKHIYVVLKKCDLVEIYKIKNIILARGEILFYVQQAKVIEYDEHYCAYKTELTEEHAMVNRDSIYMYKPFSETYNLDNTAPESNEKQFFLKPYWFVNIHY
jgi:hypothetical protein